MAFVIVQHLDPAHKSILANLVQKFTSMPTAQVEHRTLVKPNHIYVIPPNRDMILSHGALHLKKTTKFRGMHLPIDSFFRSLATGKKELAIGVVLSGTGSDGTLGLRAIQEGEGFTIVQSPESARYDGMPIRAIQAGFVDAVLPPEQMADFLMSYAQRSLSLESQPKTPSPQSEADIVQKILVLIRVSSGHDFSEYKQNTILRRIKRRMAINQLAQLGDYLDYLRQTPREADILFRELLIGVTRFFRDPEVFESLAANVITPLFTQAHAKSRPIRIWVPACSTGEEAYSLAILMAEHSDQTGIHADIQLFATDIDRVAIEKARAGGYPDTITADLSPERLRTFFSKDFDSSLYQINSRIRDMVVFAVHSAVKDPPFSKLDLICCRNLFIYLAPELQQRLLNLLHYALNPGGFLVLGSSETLGSLQKHFQTIDRKWKIFRRLDLEEGRQTPVFLPSSHPSSRTIKTRSSPIEPTHVPSPRELTEQALLTDFTPTAVLIHEGGDILYVHGHTGRFLEQTTGESTTNILKLAREGLCLPLTTAIHKVRTHKSPYSVDGVLKDGQRVRIGVLPLGKPVILQDMMLITFTELTPALPFGDEQNPNETNELWRRRVIDLEQELRAAQESLHATIETLKTTNEKLQMANEELHSSNDELQSTNEELQTSEEELQSTNEELLTVNTELQSKVIELMDANNDIKNLLDNAQVGIIFLDRNLRIRRFTQPIRNIVDLIPADIGRPLSQFVNKLSYDRLESDARSVLDTLKPVEAEVQTTSLRWYLLRITPYHTLDNRSDGVVLTFTDINQTKEDAKALRESEEKFSKVFHHAPLLMTISDPETGTIIDGNQPFFDSTGRPREEIVGKTSAELKWIAAEDRTRLREILQTQGYVHGHELTVRAADGRSIPCIYTGFLIHVGDRTQIVSIALDITDRKHAETVLRLSEHKLETMLQTLVDGVVVVNLEGRITYANRAAKHILGIRKDELEGKYYQSQEWHQIDDEGNPIPPDRLPLAIAMREQRPVDAIEHWIVSLDGEKKWLSVNAAPLFDEYGKLCGALAGFQDFTERKQAEAALNASRIRINDVMDSMSGGGQIIDFDWRYLYVNKTLIAQSGYATKEDLLGFTMMEKYPGIDDTELFGILRRCMEERVPHRMENEFTFPDGSIGWFDLSIQPVEDGIFILSYDISDRKRAEQKLAESEERFRNLFESSPIATFLWKEREGRFWLFAYNPAADRLSLGNAQRFLGMAADEIYPDRPDLIEHLHRCNTDEGTIGFETSYHSRGTQLDIAVIFTFAWVGGGVVMLHAEDITERKKTEAALRASEAKYQDLFDHAPDMYVTLDAQTARIVECNQTAVTALGYEKQELLGRPVFELYTSDSAAQALAVFWPAFLDTGEVKNERVQLLRRDGSVIEASASITAVRDLEGTIGHGRLVWRDVTERVQAEEAIKANLRQEKETVLRELAHRTKNNMFVIRSMLSLQAMHSENLEVQRIVEDVENKIFAMALVHQKLYQSQSLSRIDLGEYLHDLAPALSHSYMLIPNNVSVEVEAEAIFVLLDTAIPCGLVMTELVSNAFKHAFPNHRKGKVRINLSRVPPDHIHLQVCDNGVGVPEGFDFRHRPTLGIQTVFMIVEHQLKGSVQFISKGGGLTCDVYFADSLHTERV